MLRAPLVARLLIVAPLLLPLRASARDGAEPSATEGRPSLTTPGGEPASSGLVGPLEGSGGPGGAMPSRAVDAATARWRQGGLAVPIGETLAVNLVTMGWNRYVGDARWANVSADSIGRNLRSSWVFDDNAFWVNQAGHAYQGTWAFNAARSSGLGFWASAPFAFGASALWEIAGETERPALNDQVTTTVAGMVIGEVFHRFSGALRAEGGGWRLALASVLSPMDALNQRGFGTDGAFAAPPSRWQLSLGSVAVEGMGPARGPWTPLSYMAFSFTYGLPGTPGLALERPFDHFVVEGGYGLAKDPVATARVRGLVAGGTFEAGDVGGLYGIYLSYEVDTPPRHQISTSAIGVGGSARWEVGSGLAVEGDAIASGVLLGTGSRVDRGPEAGDRDYRFGPGQQAYAGLRLLAGNRAGVGFALRQYWLVGAGPDAGSTELLLDGSATGVVRVAGP
ncbi:MAG TPA: DUF3943 domain-containing protein, partial [Anaeromyxobacteraceae bacterium]|nr:DUF3943 domain-containing protein [Anaeromyxobacteraceae bacterium]